MFNTIVYQDTMEHLYISEMTLNIVKFQLSIKEACVFDVNGVRCTSGTYSVESTFPGTWEPFETGLPW